MRKQLYRPGFAVASAAFFVTACADRAEIDARLAIGREKLAYAAATRLDLTVFSLCSTPYSTLIRKAAENQALAEARKSLCGEL